MTSSHSDVGPELRQLAQVILDRIDPAVRAAVAAMAAQQRGPARCEQIWCPVCALGALVNGEAHPLLTVIAENSKALLAVIHAMVADPPPSGVGREPDGAGQDPDGDSSPTNQNGGYHSIPIVVEEVEDL